MDVDIRTTAGLTPPASDESDKKDDSGSELSDLDEPSGEIEPDHYWDDGKIPVFKPTMDQFRSFKSFIAKIDKYGMKSGIVKVIPPKEWRESLPALDEQVKSIKVKNPITQEFHGTHGTYTQANMEKQRSYNLPQWKALTDETNHQPPARRGERRRALDRTTRAGASKSKASAASSPSAPGEAPRKRGPGRPRVRPLPNTTHAQQKEIKEDDDLSATPLPPTPISPSTRPTKIKKEDGSDEERTPKTKGKASKTSKAGQAKSVSSRRQYNRKAQDEIIDEEAFKDFDYRTYNQKDWTPERCSELETAYWKSLNFNNPMYGADMPGSLFDESTESWNVAHLENLLDVLGQKVPGVNTTYLYLGMWKASFAWHLEDVDLYSINYIHFGAPKQWYSISQEDARRFEAAMRTVWDTDAKNCDQFLRHKTYLISPQLLQSQYNIKVNRLVHYEGEFVITFPYGYHSGYNLGYNCAESVNFATESWLDFGKVARKCHCEADSVWVDVHTIERKMRGEATPEYYEETDDDDEDEEEDDATNLPTPPGSVKGKARRAYRKRKRDPNEKDAKPKVKKLRLRIKAPSYEPCILCPSDSEYEKLLPTDNGREAHWRCALFTPETYISERDGAEIIRDVGAIDKARLELKCNFCRSKRGAVFQCSQKKCTRAYHATCAAPAGVQVDIGIVPVWGPDGTEYTDTGIDFRCRFHRIRRPKHMDAKKLDDLEENPFIRKTAQNLPVGELVQMQYYQGDIFAGNILENRRSEQTLLIETIPAKQQIEVEYKWLLVMDPSNSQLERPSPHAKPLPPELAHNSRTTADHPDREKPEIDKPFCDGHSQNKWQEFHSCHNIRNPHQIKIDLEKSKQLWYYLGSQSTEAKACYTADSRKKVHDTAGNFLETVRLADFEKSRAAAQRQALQSPSYPNGPHTHALNAMRTVSYGNASYSSASVAAKPQQKAQTPKERPYTGKYAIIDPIEKYTPKVSMKMDTKILQNQRSFQPPSISPLSQSATPNQMFKAPSAQMSPVAQMVPNVRPAPTDQMGSMPRSSSSQSLSNAGARPTLSQTSSSSDRPSSSHTNVAIPHLRGGGGVSDIDRSPRADRDTITVGEWKPPSMRYADREHSEEATSSSIGGSGGMIKPPTLRSPSSNLKSTPPDPVNALLSKYTYLAQCAKQRAPFYRSPYAPEGTYTSPWSSQSISSKDDSWRKLDKKSSLSEEYLNSLSVGQQWKIKAELKEEKALRDRRNSLQKAKESWAKYNAKWQPKISPVSGQSTTSTSSASGGLATSPSKAGWGINHWQSTAPMTTHYGGDEPSMRSVNKTVSTTVSAAAAPTPTTSTAGPPRKYNYIPPPSSSPISYSDFIPPSLSTSKSNISTSYTKTNNPYSYTPGVATVPPSSSTSTYPYKPTTSSSMSPAYPTRKVPSTLPPYHLPTTASSPTTNFSPPGLNFTAPSDFRSQILQEAQRSVPLSTRPSASVEGETTYEKFFRSIRESAAAGGSSIDRARVNGDVNGDGAGSNGVAVMGTGAVDSGETVLQGQGSPLRNEFGGEAMMGIAVGEGGAEEGL